MLVHNLGTRFSEVQRHPFSGECKTIVMRPYLVYLISHLRNKSCLADGCNENALTEQQFFLENVRPFGSRTLTEKKKSGGGHLGGASRGSENLQKMAGFSVSF